ncbi:MAG: GNAT family N-acetyltransferase [Anaeroplasmataceae bacterium]|nr:GNAT family N-acetyltransferase [Anaeroplasmataceae bacterium]MDE6414474.1 GNAT family N-acetyltransferase [Anaeroplasmataceae bacterium]
MLRELKESDASLMLECLKDKDVNQYMNIDGSNMTIDDCKNFIRNSLKDSLSKHFAIVDNQDRWVGTISLKNIDSKTKVAEYAIITSKEVHGKGLALEATKEILDYGFNTLNLNRIYLNVVEDNIRANKFYLKCGFEFEGTFRQAIYIKNKIYNLNWYAILKGCEKNEEIH